MQANKICQKFICFSFFHILISFSFVIFELLSFIQFWVFEFCHILSFLVFITFWVFDFCHILSFWFLSHFDFFSWQSWSPFMRKPWYFAVQQLSLPHNFF